MIQSFLNNPKFYQPQPPLFRKIPKTQPPFLYQRTGFWLWWVLTLFKLWLSCNKLEWLLLETKTINGKNVHELPRIIIFFLLYAWQVVWKKVWKICKKYLAQRNNTASTRAVTICSFRMVWLTEQHMKNI